MGQAIVREYSDPRASSSPCEAQNLGRATATFSAAFLHALEPIIRADQDRDTIGHKLPSCGLLVEPVASGGAILVAREYKTCAAIFDRNAHASRTMRLHISDATFAAATPPKLITMRSHGERQYIDPPEWAQPGLVRACEHRISVAPKEPPPGLEHADELLLNSEEVERGVYCAGGYRLHLNDIAPNWRGPFNRVPLRSDGRLFVGSEWLARFSRISPLFESDLLFSPGGQLDAIIISAEGVSDFVGFINPLDFPPTGDQVPVWARTGAVA